MSHPERLLLFCPPPSFPASERQLYEQQQAAKALDLSPPTPPAPLKLRRARPRRARPVKIPVFSEAELLMRQRLDDDSLFDDLDELIELPSLPSVVRLPVLNKPRSRTECASVPRPCPFVSCRFNLYLDVRNDGVLRLNFPDREPSEMTASCALDLATDGPRTLDAIAALMGMSKERARQLEASGLTQVAQHFKPEDVD